MPSTAQISGKGDGKSGSMTLDQLLKRTNVLYCLDCGKCTGTCPAAIARPGFSPRRVIELALMDDDGSRTALNRYLWDCLTCGKCANYCPEEVWFSEFVRARRGDAYHEGNYSVKNHGGIVYSISQAMADLNLKQKRMDWVKGTKISDKGEVLLFTGCLPYFELFFKNLKLEYGSKVLNNAVKIMNKAGITPAVMSNEVCCGHDDIWSGNLERFTKLAKKNIAAIKATGAKKIVTICPECATTLKNDYAEFLGEKFEVVHITQYLAELLKDGKIKVKKNAGKVTFHDPCRLVQHMNIVDAPREVIKAVGGDNFTEMRESGVLASCCGTTLWRNCDALSEIMRLDRLKQAQETGAQTLLTACPKCQIHFRCTLSTKCDEVGLDKNLKVEDIVTYVAENLEG